MPGGRAQPPWTLDLPVPKAGDPSVCSDSNDLRGGWEHRQRMDLLEVISENTYCAPGVKTDDF